MEFFLHVCKVAPDNVQCCDISRLPDTESGCVVSMAKLALQFQEMSLSGMYIVI